MKKVFTTNSETETELIGAKVAEMLSNDGFVALYGGLGAGKTVFTRGIVKKLLPEAVRLVHSPTFALVNEYRGKDLTVYHFDMYRVSGDDELYAIGFDDYLGNGIIVTEWSENIEGSIPNDALKVTLERINDTTRQITVEKAD